MDETADRTEQEIKTQEERLFPVILSHRQRLRAGWLAVLTIAVSVLSWQLYRFMLDLDFARIREIGVWLPLVLTFLSFMLTLSLVATIALLVHDRLVARGIMIVTALAPIAAFGLPLYSFIAVLLLILAYLQYDERIKQEEHLRVKFSVSKSIRYGLTAAMTMTLLAISLTFYGVTIAKRNLSTSPLDTIIELSGNAVNQVLALQVEAYNPRESVDDFLLRIVAHQITNPSDATTPLSDLSPDLSNPIALVEQLGKVDLDEVIATLPQDVRTRTEGLSSESVALMLAREGEAAFQHQLALVRDELLASLKVEATGATPMGEVVKQFIGTLLRDRFGTYESLFPPILALSVFFALSIFTFLYAYVIRFLSHGFFFLLKKVHMVKIEPRQATVEVVNLNDA